MIDISSTHIRAELIVDGRAHALWVRGQDVESDRSIFFGGQSFVDLPIIESVTLEVGLGLSGSATLVVHADADLGLALLESELLRIGNRIRLQIGYPAGGGYTPVFEGMTARPDLSIVEDGMQITINVQGGGFAAARNSGRRLWESTSYAEVIEEVAGLEHNQWRVELPPRLTGSEAPIDPLYIERQTVSQSNRPDWVFLGRVARLAGCEMTMGRDDDGSPVFQIYRRGELYAAAPRHTFVYRGQIDLETRFPVMGFESAAEGTWLPQIAGAIYRADIDPETGEIPEDTVDQAARAEVVPRLGGGEVVRGAAVVDQAGSGVSAAAPDEGMTLTASAADQERLPAEVLEQLADEGAIQGGFQATLRSLGIPDLLPGAVVRVVNIGVLSGNYLVQTMNHEAGGNGWDMTISLLRNAPGSENAIAEAIGSVYDNVNDDEAQGGEGDDVEIPVGDPEA